jgi:hypothetical protein
MLKHLSIRSLLLIYGVCALTVFFSWRQAQFNGPTGDEPHYLIMANGLAQHGALEQTLPYQDAFQPGQPERFHVPRGDMHTIAGPHGLFNMHNLGLPLLLALPFALGGVDGAKLFMLLCGAGVLLCAWKMAGLFTSDGRQRWLAVLATCIASPLLPAATQIYPDVVAGLIAMTGLYWFLTTSHQRGAAAELLLAAAVVYLPWLQIKFGLTCAVLVLAVAAKIYRESRDLKRIARILVLAGASCLLLASYNLYAFGKASGPYLADAIEVSKTSLMVFLGLHFDPNQGFLLQNPINLVGLLGIGWLWRVNRPFVLLWAAVFLTLLAPNALHPNWYGGWSFSGRFGWPAAMVFMVVTLYGLLELARRRDKLFLALTALSVLLQAYLFSRYAFRSVDLYNRPWGTPLSDYSLYYRGIQDWLPGLYNADWAYGHAPNYAWLALVLMLVAAGFARTPRWRRGAAWALWACGVAVLAAGGSPLRERREVVLAAAVLPSQTGRIDGDARVAEPGVDAPGVLNFGPYMPLARAKYRITLKYSSTAPGSEPVAAFDIYNTSSRRQILGRELPGTDGKITEFVAEFAVTAPWQEQLMEFRNYWAGKRQFKLYEIRVRPI